MHTRALVLAAATFVSSVASAQVADDIQVGSQAQLWKQRGKAERAAYLEGLCAGLSESKLGDLSCGATFSSSPSRRFCYLVHKGDGQEAVAYFDDFYRNKNQTEIPNWAAVAAYNDRSCRENVVSGVLQKMQKRNECIRQAINMNNAVAAEARRAQEEHCKSLQF